jgi:hypothetical protein
MGPVNTKCRQSVGLESKEDDAHGSRHTGMHIPFPTCTKAHFTTIAKISLLKAPDTIVDFRLILDP